MPLSERIMLTLGSITRVGGVYGVVLNVYSKVFSTLVVRHR